MRDGAWMAMTSELHCDYSKHSNSIFMYACTCTYMYTPVLLYYWFPFSYGNLSYCQRHTVVMFAWTGVSPSFNSPTQVPLLSLTARWHCVHLALPETPLVLPGDSEHLI